MNPNYEIIEQIFRLDIDAGLVTADQRNAQRELAELAKKTKASEEIISKTRADMSFHEAEMRRIYKRLDELEERKADKVSRLTNIKTDDEHRGLKRDVDNIDRDIREAQRLADDTEARIEQFKVIFKKAEADLIATKTASEDEREKAEQAESKSSGRLQEIATVRETYLSRLDDRLMQHYRRVAKITRNPNGPINRVVNGACGNCRIGLLPQILNNIARGKTIENCPNCSHLLLPSSNV